MRAGSTSPRVTRDPLGDTVADGATASFSATASGIPAPTVRWQVSSGSGAKWANVAGATGTTYSFTATGQDNGKRYRAVFANAAGAATTRPATLTVTAIPPGPPINQSPTQALTVTVSGPVVIAQPVSVSAASGATASFSAAASGVPAPTVRWQVSTDAGANWSDIPGATANAYALAAVAAENGDEYRAVFTNTVATAATNPATLAVTTPASSPQITAQPPNQGVVDGAGASFSATASGVPAPTVQWQVSENSGASWTAIPGATSTTYSFAATPSESGEQFRAVFTNTAGSVATNPATLTVTAASSAPQITVQPASESVATGDTASFSAAASGAPAPDMQWQSSTNSGASWTNIPGATSPTFSLTATTIENGSEYRAVFTNAAGTATTNPATLTVTGAPSRPQITAQPADESVVDGGTASFSATASGVPAPSVRWQVSTNSGASWTNIAGATAGTYTLAALTADDGNEYRAVFTNAAGTATTNPAMLTVSIASEASTNWSGYADTGMVFTAVSGSWHVPALTCPSKPDEYSVVWVGIDGEDSSTVEQDGTEADCIGGSPKYFAWYEMYPDLDVNDGDQVVLSTSTYPVSPGDAISASVSVSHSTWTLEIVNSTRGWNFHTTVDDPTPTPSQASAEWIVERPQECGQLGCSPLPPLADFASVSFTDAAATGAGTSGPITAFPVTAEQIIGPPGSTVLAAPGPLDLTGDAFTDSWFAGS